MYDCNKALPFTLKLWKDVVTCPFCGTGAKCVIDDDDIRIMCNVTCPHCGLHWDFGFDIKAIQPGREFQVIESLICYAKNIEALP